MPNPSEHKKVYCTVQRKQKCVVCSRYERNYLSLECTFKVFIRKNALIWDICIYAWSWRQGKTKKSNFSVSNSP